MTRHLALAVLLASVYLAAGAVVDMPTTKCPADCKAPTCMCAANNPPGNLLPEELPQFVLISHDNALDSLPYQIMQGVLGNKVQKNGCNVPVTWFAMFYHSDCIAGQKALARGDEVAMQTNRFNPTDPFTATDPAPKYDSRDPKTGEPSVAIEITMSRKHWHEYCNISYSNMVGFRAPNYYNNPAIRKTLSKEGYLYDATLIERWYPNSPTSPSESLLLWPYTMDGGIPQECNYMGDEVGKCLANENYKGLWEVPLYQAQLPKTGDCMGVGNYGSTKAEMPPIADMEKFLKGLLDTRLANGKVPLSISTIYGWLVDESIKVDPTCMDAGCAHPPNENAKALASFIDYALKKPEVRFVTFSDLIRWMQDPVPLSQFDEWVQCKVPGVKADLTAVNLTAAEKANAFYMLQDAKPVATPTPAPVPAPTVEAPTPATTVIIPMPAPSVEEPTVVVPTPATTATAPVPAPVASQPLSGAAAVGKAVAAAVAVLAAMLLAL